jgi:hypothetical protein
MEKVLKLKKATLNDCYDVRRVDSLQKRATV